MQTGTWLARESRDLNSMHGRTVHSLVASGKKKVKKEENLTVIDYTTFIQNDKAPSLPKNLLLVESN